MCAWKIAEEDVIYRYLKRVVCNVDLGHCITIVSYVISGLCVT